MPEITRNYIFLLIIIVIAIFLNLFILSFQPDLWWDESVYILVGKHIFSFGERGFFEILRPPVLPIILGFIWILGLNPLGFGKLIMVFSHIMLIFLIYITTKRTYKEDVAILASSFFAFTPFVYLYSSKILTAILANVFGFIAIYLFIKEKNISKTNLFLAGIFSGFAFLTRFPGGIFFAGIFLALFLTGLKNQKATIKNLIVLLVGFFIVVSPYMTYNYLAYGSPVFPFMEANYQIVSTPWFHSQDPLFYVKELPLQNIFFVFMVFGVIFFFLKRDFKDFRKNTLIITLVLFILYFQTLEAKNIRFSMVFLSLISIFSAYGIHEISRSFLKKWTTHVVVIILLVSGISGVFFVYNSNIKYLRTPNPEEPYQKFINYFIENPVEGTILTSNVMIGAYVDNKIISLYRWRTARGILDKYNDESSILTLDSCSIICEKSDVVCFNLKEEFIDYIEKNYEKVLDEKSESCSYVIFKIK